MRIKVIFFLLILVFSIFYTANVLSEDYENTSKLLYEKKCSRCHNLDRINQAIKSPDQWSATVGRMRQKDTSWMDPMEARTIALYLASNVSQEKTSEHKQSKYSYIPTYLPKLFGFITLSLLFITVALGFTMTHGKRKLIKIHKIIAYTTLASGVIHGILIFITH